MPKHTKRRGSDALSCPDRDPKLRERLRGLTYETDPLMQIVCAENHKQIEALASRRRCDFENAEPLRFVFRIPKSAGPKRGSLNVGA